jgi:hypothetical protein
MSNYIIKVKNTSGTEGTIIADAGFSYTDKLNEVNDGQLRISGTGEVKRSLFEIGSEIYIYRNEALEFRGIINSLSYLHAGGISADLQGYEIWLGKENGDYPNSPWDSTASSTIASSIISESSKFSAGTIQSGETLDFRVEDTSSLWNALSSLIKRTAQDIGIDYSDLSVDILDHKGNSTSVMTLNDGVQIQDLTVRHTYPVANDVRVYGQGEGNTRIKSNTGHGQDATSKATYGTIRKIYDDPSVTSEDEANTLADKLVAQWKTPVKIYEFDIINPNKNLVAGDVITLNSSTKGLINEEVRVVAIDRGFRNNQEFMTLQVSNKEYSSMERGVNRILAEIEKRANDQQTYDQYYEEYSNQNMDTYVGGAEISYSGGWADFGTYNISTMGNLRGTHININGSSMGSIIWEQLDMGANKITNLGTPTNAGDAANKSYVDTHGGGSSLFDKDVGNNWIKVHDQNYSLVPNATGSGYTYNNLGGPGIGEQWADCFLLGTLHADMGADLGGDLDMNNNDILSVGDISSLGTIQGSILNINASSAGNIIAGNLSMGGSKITNLGTPTSTTDAATKSYVDGHNPWNGSASSNLDMNQYDIVDCDDITCGDILCSLIQGSLLNIGASSAINYISGDLQVTGMTYASGKFRLPVGTNLY